MKNLSFLLVMSLLLTFSCKKNSGSTLLDVGKDQELLSDYFMAATVGMISATDELKFVFKVPLENEISEAVIKNSIKLDPHVEGTVSLSNNTILTFTPKESLQSNQTYNVIIDLKSLDSKRFDKNINYQIKTFEQDMVVEREGLLINDDGSVTILLVAKTADKANVENIKKCFTSDSDDIVVMERDINEYEVSINYKTGMKRTSKVSYDGKQIGCDAKGDVALFDLNTKEFGVVYTHHEADTKEFNIYFSQRLNKQQDLTGLLKVQNENGSYTIKNNVLTIFLGESNNANSIQIKLDKNIKSQEGEILLTDYTFDIAVDVDVPGISFVSDGNYFPSEGDFKIPVKTRALEAVRVVVVEIKQENVAHYLAWQSLANADYYNLRMYGKPIYDQIVPLNKGIRDNEGWTVYGIDLSSQIKKNPGSIYHIGLDYGPENTTLTCKKDLKQFKVNSQLPDQDYFKVRAQYYNDYYYENEYYHWEENANPCKLSFYVNKQPVQKLFICSDYGVIAKKAGANYHIAISKLMDLSHVSDAIVTLYDLQAEKIATSKTSSQGFATFENLKNEAAVLKVEKGSQVTYMALDPDQSNSLTEFDISGDRSETETEFFAYADRDVWRPGDSIYVDLMVNKAHSDLPKGMPITMTFYNTENLIIDEQIASIDLDSKLIYNFVMHTPPSAKTGVYRCLFQIGPKQINKNIRIETIKPNTAEVIYDFDNDVENTIYSSTISGSITAKYLTGFEIKSAKVKATARGRKMAIPFPSYKEYQFDVYDNQAQDNNFAVLDVQTNENGTAAFTGQQDLKTFNTPITASIETETILPGGGTNKEGKSVTVSPFDTYIGAQRKEGTGWDGNHTFSENIDINIVNITNRGKLTTASNTVSYTLQQHISSWWVDKYRLRSEGNFVNADYWKDVKSSDTQVKGKGKITFAKGSLAKGAYKLTMTDNTSGHRTQVYFTVYDGKEQIPGSQPYIVKFQTDKDSYKTGETVKVMLPDIDGAKALISVERGNRVIEQVWFNLAKSDNVLIMNTNENWAPNVYIHVTIMQKYKQESNDLPLRMYGIQHIKMDGSTNQLKPVTTLPEKLESNRSYTFAVSEAEGRAMEYTVAIVDEGLLNLTGFATPDPSKHFNGKFPLLVKTWDIYQYLINYFKGKFAGIITIGGDDAYNPDAIAEIDRFKPVSIHLGSFKVSKGGKNTHTIAIPNYIGKVRLMVVACSDNNFGKHDKLIPVKNPLMVQSQFPRTLNVSDKLQLPVAILRDEATIKTADLQVKTTPGMVKGFGSSKVLSFNGTNQILQTYDIEVLNQTGKLSVDMSVSGGGKSMKETTDILINYPNSYESAITKNIIESGKKLDVSTKPKGYKEVFTSKIMISGLKVPNFTQYSEDLIDYPYGCLEQTTSAGFGQLYLDKILQLDPKENRMRMENLQTTINKLTRFQQSSGKFNYWDGTYYHAWSDIYAGNFMIEMQRLGYFPSKSDMLSRWKDAHIQIANNWAAAELTDNYAYESESMAQAFRLFVLAKGSKPAKPAMNKFVSSNKSVNPITWWLIAGSFQLSGYDSKAKEFLAKAESLQKNYNTSRSYNSFGDQGRDWAIIVEILSYFDGEKDRMENYYDQMVETLNANPWASTQTKGFAFIAAFKYFGKALGVVNKIDYTISGLPGGMKSYQHSAFEPKLIRISKESFDKPISIQNKGKGKLYVYQTDRFIDSELSKPASASNIGIKVDYYNTTRKTSGITGIRLGDDVIITVAVSNPSALAVSDLALNVKMPAGWELINPRLYETETNAANNFTYQDFKDDRVYTFFNLLAGQSERYSFRAKAAFTGDFFMPSVSCEHMYKGNINAKSRSQRVVIGK